MAASETESAAWPGRLTGGGTPGSDGSQFEGHGSCATGSKQWINAIISTSGGISVHPNATGEQQMADILEAALAANGIS